MPEHDDGRWLRLIFQRIVDRPVLVLLLGIVFIVLSGSALPRLLTDTSPNAFLEKDNPALVYRELIKDQFGLSDPLIIAIVNEGPDGIFDPATLALVDSLTEAVENLPNVEQSKVFSLATQKNISGSEYGLEVEPYLDHLPATREEAGELRRAIFDFPLYLGSLVARDGNATMIVAELIDEDRVSDSYTNFVRLTDEVSGTVPGVRLHVAGEGAIAGYMGEYIEADARVLIPLAVVTIFLIIILAFRGLMPALITGVVVIASVVSAIGAMAFAGVPFYVITNALPIILIGIAVADAIHIYSQYYDLRATAPEQNIDDTIVQAMEDMFRPITLTSLTTIAGFFGLSFSSQMPPVSHFGLFAALGVFVAWLFSLVLLPALIKLTESIRPRRFRRNAPGSAYAGNRVMRTLGEFTLTHPRSVVLFFFMIAMVGLYAASHIKIDEDPVEVFDSSEPLYRADRAINAYMDGTNMIDVVVEATKAEGLFASPVLKKIEQLQAYALTLPHVGGATSIVDYLKQINRAVNGGEQEYYRLPDSEALVAQYFLLYSTSADPTDFEEEVDYDYRIANLRISLDTNRYQHYKSVVESLQHFIDQEINDELVSVTLSGRLTLNYHWIKDLGRGHFVGMAFALILVWSVAALLFSSVMAGFYTVIPVVVAILFVYSAMALTGIAIGVGTSMFAAVAVGLGVDYSIHTLSRLQLLGEAGGSVEETGHFEEFYQTTGRALMFNFLAIAVGFGVLMSSKIASLFKFGSIVVLAVSGSFLASMILLPAMIKLFRPAFISNYPAGDKLPGVRIANPVGLFLCFCAFALLSLAPLKAIAETSQGECGQNPPGAQSQDLEAEITADDIVSSVNAVDGGSFVTRNLTMKMLDRRGKERVRDSVIYRKQYDGVRKTVLVFEKPANVKDTAFLIWDYDSREEVDDQWLYLPALRKTRRVSAADRGDYFFGTDFTFDDMKLEGKLSASDYEFQLLGEVELAGVNAYHLEATTVTPEIAEELGYSRSEVWIDPSNWMLLKAEFFDLKNTRFKSLAISDIQCVQGVWTRHRQVMENLKTGHQTTFVFSDIDYQSPVSDRIFNSRTFSRGH